MPQPRAPEVDPLEGGEPRPPTLTQRRLIAAIGGLAIVTALGILVRVLGPGATPTSASEELTAARPTRNHPAAPARPGE
jgi:hypothetical protein